MLLYAIPLLNVFNQLRRGHFLDLLWSQFPHIRNVKNGLGQLAEVVSCDWPKKSPTTFVMLTKSPALI